MRIKSVAVLGAGAVGSYIIWGLSNRKDIEVIEKINETNPDFVWIGLGAPKQEKWMFD